MAKKIEDVADLPGVGAKTAEKLKASGYLDLMAVAAASPKELADRGDIGELTAIKMIAAARDTLDIGFETGEDEESRAEKLDKQNVINSEQFEKLATYCLTEDKSQWTPIGNKMAQAYKINILSSLPASKYEEALKRCEAVANGNN